jgi:hypothetical protein
MRMSAAGTGHPAPRQDEHSGDHQRQPPPAPRQGEQGEPTAITEPRSSNHERATDPENTASILAALSPKLQSVRILTAA